MKKLKVLEIDDNSIKYQVTENNEITLEGSVYIPNNIIKDKELLKKILPDIVLGKIDLNHCVAISGKEESSEQGEQIDV